MSFHEVQFPTNISAGSRGGPEFLTRVLVLGSGHEQRSIEWEKARAKYNVGYGVREQADLDTVLAFFYARRGRAYGFRYKDWRDYSVTGQEIGLGDGEETEFQLIKTYTNNIYSYDRTITKPVSGTVVIYVDGVQQVAGWSVNTTTGLVTFDTPPEGESANSESAGARITADFEFDVPVRFDIDWLPQTIEYNEAGSVQDIPLVEIRI